MKRILVILGALVAILVAAAIAATFLIDPNHFRPMLETELTRALGREVHPDPAAGLVGDGARAARHRDVHRAF